MQKIQKHQKSSSKYVHSPKIDERRRRLFTSKNSEDDLEHITPIMDHEPSIGVDNSDLETENIDCSNNTSLASISSDDFGGLPTRSFYSSSERSAKNETNSPGVIEKTVSTPRVNLSKPKRAPRKIIRKLGQRSRLGLINAGVDHKIKPKRKQVSKNVLLEAATTIMNNSPLNAYLAQNQSQNKPPENKNNDIDDALSEYLKDLENIKAAPQKQINTEAMKESVTSGSVYRKTAVSSQNPKQPDSDDEILFEYINDLETLNSRPQKQINTDSCKESLENITAKLLKSRVSNDSDDDNDSNKRSRRPSWSDDDEVPVEAEKENRKFFKSVRANPAKKFKKLPKGQMLLDFGQKNFGLTECHECQIVYHKGDPSDEIMHESYHVAAHTLRFDGWKNEHVVAEFTDRRIIQILPNDSKIWFKKVRDLLDLVNRELGYYDMSYDINNSQIYLCIKNRKIAGCLAAEPKTCGRKMLEEPGGCDFCSEETYPIKCGISRIWVAEAFRKQKIATNLLNCLKKNFTFGQILTNSDIAISSPTELGKKFARKYFGTPNYLLYDV